MKIDWTQFYECESERYRFLPGDDPDIVHRWRFLQAMLRGVSFNSALDVGCGDGYLAEQLRGWRSASVVGIDGSVGRIRFASKRFGQSQFCVGSIFSLPFKQAQYDLVMAIEIIEHLETPESALRELARVAGQYVLVTVPYKQRLVDVLCPHCHEQFPLNGHVQSFTAERLTGMMRSCGIEPVRTDIARWLLNRPNLRRLTWPVMKRVAPKFFDEARYLGFLGVVKR